MLRMYASTKTIQFLKLFGLLTYWSEVPKRDYDFRKNKILN